MISVTSVLKAIRTECLELCMLNVVLEKSFILQKCVELAASQESRHFYDDELSDYI
jgi:hypothetical protein